MPAVTTQSDRGIAAFVSTRLWLYNATEPEPLVYDKYTRFCEEEGYPAASFNELGEILLSLPGVDLSTIDADGVTIDAYDGLTFRD